MRMGLHRLFHTQLCEKIQRGVGGQPGFCPSAIDSMVLNSSLVPESMTERQGVAHGTDQYFGHSNQNRKDMDTSRSCTCSQFSLHSNRPLSRRDPRPPCGSCFRGDQPGLELTYLLHHTRLRAFLDGKTPLRPIH